MILRKRTVELLGPEDMPAELRGLVDRVLVLGELPCSAITMSAAQPTLMAVGLNRAAALRRLCERVAHRDTTPHHATAPQPRLSA
jgi:hypothetical protein